MTTFEIIANNGQTFYSAEVVLLAVAGWIVSLIPTAHDNGTIPGRILNLIGEVAKLGDMVAQYFGLTKPAVNLPAATLDLTDPAAPAAPAAPMAAAPVPAAQ